VIPAQPLQSRTGEVSHRASSGNRGQSLRMEQAFHGPAGGVAANDDVAHAEDRHRIFDAGGNPNPVRVIVDRNDIAGSPFHEDFSRCAVGQQRRVNTGVPTGEKQGIRFLHSLPTPRRAPRWRGRFRYESAALRPGYGAQWVPWVGGKLQSSTGIRWDQEAVRLPTANLLDQHRTQGGLERGAFNS
jgi:hypothetical protein